MELHYLNDFLLLGIAWHVVDHCQMHCNSVLSEVLAPLIGNSVMFVCSSSEFLSFITSKTIRPDEHLVSFDDVSLFTKVPVELAVDVVNCRLSPDNILQ